MSIKGKPRSMGARLTGGRGVMFGNSAELLDAAELNLVQVERFEDDAVFGVETREGLELAFELLRRHRGVFTGDGDDDDVVLALGLGHAVGHVDDALGEHRHLPHGGHIAAYTHDCTFFRLMDMQNLSY
jgi:hypothetical protein